MNVPAAPAASRARDSGTLTEAENASNAAREPESRGCPSTVQRIRRLVRELVPAGELGVYGPLINAGGNWE